LQRHPFSKFGKALAEKDIVESTTRLFLASELVQEKQRDTPKSFFVFGKI